MSQLTPKKKLTLATTSLAGCFGCHMSFLDIDENILKLVELYEFNKSPIDDIKTFTKECDIGLVEGGCCNSENVHVLRSFRKNCKILVSVGQCAITGGLPAMRNGLSLKEIFHEVYETGPTLANALVPNDEELPIILDRVYPCHEIVKVDYFLPGCPPNAELFLEFLNAVADGEPPKSYTYSKFKYD